MGFGESGAYSLRNAMMFLYPFFALISYLLYKRDRHYWFVVLLLVSFAICRLVNGGRATIVAIFVSILFIILVKTPLRVRVVLSIILLLFLGGYVNKYAFGSKGSEFFAELNTAIKYVEAKHYAPEPIYPKSYNPKRRSMSYLGGMISYKLTKEQEEENKKLDEKYKPIISNGHFRLLIWRDMVKQLIDGRKVFGFGMGHPSRCYSIEKLRMAWGEWSRDGWIGAHNSYVHIIYRVGVLGFVLIWYLFFLIVRAVKRITSDYSIIMCAVIVWYFTTALFQLTFELPYYAIPMWVLFGIFIKESEAENDEGRNQRKRKRKSQESTRDHCQVTEPLNLQAGSFILPTDV